MSQERTEQLTDQQMRDALQRLIEGKHSLHIPPLPTDEDFVIAAAIDEALKSRAHIAGLKATAQELFEGRTNDWGEIKRLNATIADLTAKVQDRDAEIIRQRERGDRLDSELHKQNCRNQDQAEEIERLRGAMENARNELKHIKDKEQDAIIAVAIDWVIMGISVALKGAE